MSLGPKMANPQPNVFVRWSKELYKAKMKMRISGVENQIVDTIAYHTYGQLPQQKIAHISNEKFREETGLSAVAVSKAITQLLKKNVITKFGNKYDSSYGIQKDYEEWHTLPKKVIRRKTKASQKTPKKLLPKMVSYDTKNGNNTGVTPIILNKEDIYVESSKIILKKINNLSGKKFTDFDPIIAVLKSKKFKPKITEEDCLKVVNFKWLDDYIRQNGYFTPSSLFRITKFKSKLDEANNAGPIVSDDFPEQQSYSDLKSDPEPING